ncbi:unnamed protein product, partial [Brachionus calyciflorus]
DYFNEKLNQLKRVEIQDLHIDGLLLEIDSPKITRLNSLFDKLNLKTSDYNDLKLLSEKINELKDQIQIVETTPLNSSQASPGQSSNPSQQNRPVKTPKLEKTKINKIPKLIEASPVIEIELTSPCKPKIKPEPKPKKQKIKDTDNNNKTSRKRDISQVEDTSEEDQCGATKCLKPAGDNIKWVQCDGDCQKWFHMVCVGITKIKRKDKYLCHLCTETNTQDDNSNSSSNSSLNASSNKIIPKIPILELSQDRPTGLLDDIKNSLRENLVSNNKVPKIDPDATESLNMNNSIEIIE